MDGPNLLARAEAYRDGGWRLVLINATAVLPTEELDGGAFDISWTFARDNELEHLRERVLPAEQVPSISAYFGGAFLFENELRELFGIDVTDIAIDLQGQLYKTAERVPFSPSAIRARIEKIRPPAPPKVERPTPPAPKAEAPTPAPAPEPAPAPRAGTAEAAVSAATPLAEPVTPAGDTTSPEARP